MTTNVEKILDMSEDEAKIALLLVDRDNRLKVSMAIDAVESDPMSLVEWCKKNLALYCSSCYDNVNGER